MSPVDWKELLGTNDPSLNDIAEAKELAQSINDRVLSGYGDGDASEGPAASAPAPASKAASADSLSDTKLAAENLKYRLEQVIGERGAASQGAKRLKAELESVKLKQYELQAQAGDIGMRQALAASSSQRATKQVDEQIEQERKEWLSSINQVVKPGTELAAWMHEQFEQKRVTPEQRQIRIDAKAAEIVARIDHKTETDMPRGTPAQFQQDFRPPLREVDAPILDAKSGYVKYLKGKGTVEALDKARSIEKGELG